MNILTDLENLKDERKAIILQRFFKTGKGEYGEGDVFLGVKVPEQRKIARKYKDIPLDDVQKLLNSMVHEHRLTGAFICVLRYKEDKKRIFEFYLKNLSGINNWDLVDTTAPNIIGDYLIDKDRGLLYEFAKSDDLWKKRIAILCTYEFIKKGEYKDTFALSEILLGDEHDLIHKGVGWMLREVGKRISQDAEEDFLKKHYRNMPRTMLRYAIERFSEEKRRRYMSK